ncbi:MAG: amino acid permease [Acidobacteria bacterium]|nr:amino acid permease [Acidobacteriota bacterium]
MNQLFRTKSIDALIAASDEPDKRLQRTLGAWSLMALGIGAVIGSGIFILTGTAAAGEVRTYHSLLNVPLLDLLLSGSASNFTIGRPGAGPGVALSFFITALVCGFAALCYAEMACAIPVAGSAYTYAYATLGEFTAWMIGWNLVLEYAVSNMAVAVGFSAHVTHMVEGVFGFQLPSQLTTPAIVGGEWTGAWFNLPGFLVVMLLTWLLVFGIKESARANDIMVLVKVVAILIFIFGAARAVDSSHWKPFLPNGYSGVLTGAAIVFFTYIGFDSVSTAAEECKNPQRDLPIGILGTLVACSILYVGVAIVLTGIADWRTLNNAAPVVGALKALNMNTLWKWVDIGALGGMVSSLLVFQYGQARVWFAMSRDGLLPKFFSRIHPIHRTPHISTWIAGFAVAIPSGVWDVGTFADLSSIGTLFAFFVVSAGVLVLRKKHPERGGSFRVPFGALFPVLSMVSCLVLMMGLPLETWIRFVGWSIVGIIIYFSFGRKNSALAS